MSKEPSDLSAKQAFKVFQDGGAQTHVKSTVAPPSEESHSHVNDKDTPKPQAHCSKLLTTSGAVPTLVISTSVKRTPLADVTKAAFSRPRSLSGALAEIARLEDDLDAMKSENKALKGKNRKLRGEIIAYKDALYQADQDAGYL
ncbi:hypothetical protein G6514_000109 [Epicoccum nigrum]|nr:hypothetical protein G6514_000109 [Epicoccum nigrum]